MDKTDLKYQEVEQGSYVVVAAEAVEPSALGASAPAADASQTNNVSADGEDLSLTADFIRFLCCAFTFNNHDYPKDFGFKNGGTCLCYEYRGELCRFPQNDLKACFHLWAGSAECIYPRKCYREYWQCFCFECFAQLPIPEQGIRRLPKLSKERDITSNFAPASNVLFCCAGGDFCSYYSCSCDFPSCLGCYRKGVCLCCDYEEIHTKPMCCVDNKPDPHTLCILGKTRASLVTPSTCWKCIGQTCCVDYRTGFPCDAEVPCILSLCCFCTACVDWQCNVTCCRTIAQITGYDGKGIAARNQAQLQSYQAPPQQQTHLQLRPQIAQAHVVKAEMVPTAPVKQY